MSFGLNIIRADVQLKNQNITVSMTSERGMNFDDIIPEMYRKGNAEWISQIMTGEKYKKPFMESLIDIFPELCMHVCLYVFV